MILRRTLIRYLKSFFRYAIIFIIIVTIISFWSENTRLNNKFMTNQQKQPRSEAIVQELLEKHKTTGVNIRNERNLDFNTKPKEAKLTARQALLLSPEEIIYEEEIKSDEALIVPGLGDFGEGVNLEGEEKVKGDLSFVKWSVNSYVSDRISLTRSLKDYRHPDCKALQYDEVLPSASVVLVVHNEILSLVLRTIWSVINTGGRYVKEVVVIDDLSDYKPLLGKLDYYIKSRFPKNMIILHRLKERSGLIRARLAGARLATGDVLVFLDCHCEGTVDWLRPLLHRIKQDRRAVLVPIIDSVDSKTLFYSSFLDYQIGGFKLTGSFDWILVSEREKARKGSDTAPARTPTMAGGLFAMERNYFWEIGSYDDKMEGWGGENIEMSFRIWQCGGIMETIPCSRIGHVFRKFHPYKIPNNKDTYSINTARLALVWMDDYARFFFLGREKLMNTSLIGDISERKKLRERLQCKSFDWFLDNVYPEKFIPNKHVRGWGRFQNPKTNLCLDSMGRDLEHLGAVGLYFCHKTLMHTQLYSLTLEGTIRTEEKCIQVPQKSNANSNGRILVISNCESGKSDQKWRQLPSGQIQHIESQLCLDATGLKSSENILVQTCVDGNPYQIWYIEFYITNNSGNLAKAINTENIRKPYPGIEMKWQLLDKEVNT